MKRNVGTADRIARIVLGLGVISLAFWGPKSAWAWLGIIPLLTGLVGYCGVYTLIRVNTCRR
jgi:hypothetical protein